MITKDDLKEKVRSINKAISGMGGTYRIAVECGEGNAWFIRVKTDENLTSSTLLITCYVSELYDKLSFMEKSMLLCFTEVLIDEGHYFEK